MLILYLVKYASPVYFAILGRKLDLIVIKNPNETHHRFILEIYCKTKAIFYFRSIKKIYSVHISTLLGAQGANPETSGRGFEPTFWQHQNLSPMHQTARPRPSNVPIKKKIASWIAENMGDTWMCFLTTGSTQNQQLLQHPGGDSNPHSDYT